MKSEHIATEDIMMETKKPDEFSVLAMYGDRGVFLQNQEKGYTEVAFGSGQWVRGSRIVALWVFYHDLHKNIITYQHPKFDSGSFNVSGTPFERKYAESEFEEYRNKMKILIGSRVSLADILAQWA